MIPSGEIREKARVLGVPESTIERDYVQNWVLWALSDVDMAFKGGTCIRKLYVPNYRFSDDLDFTLMEDTGRRNVDGMIRDAILDIKDESGIDFLDDFRVQENFNGFEVSLYFRMLWSGGSPIKIKIDLTARSRERILLPVRKRALIHRYSDSLKADLKTYALEEIFAEKVRSLFERTRPRDLYDVWELENIVDMQIVDRTLPEKFAYRGIDLDSSALIPRKEDFGSAWRTSLRHQIKDLPDFEIVFRDVMDMLEK